MFSSPPIMWTHHSPVGAIKHPAPAVIRSTRLLRLQTPEAWDTETPRVSLTVEAVIRSMSGQPSDTDIIILTNQTNHISAYNMNTWKYQQSTVTLVYEEFWFLKSESLINVLKSAFPTGFFILNLKYICLASKGSIFGNMKGLSILC